MGVESCPYLDFGQEALLFALRDALRVVEPPAAPAVRLPHLHIQYNALQATKVLYWRRQWRMLLIVKLLCIKGNPFDCNSDESAGIHGD